MIFTANGVVWDPLSIDGLIHKAELVVQGKVLRRTCRIDDAGVLFTQIELQVLEVWKGQVKDNPLVVVHGGGRVGNRETVVSGQVDYQVGEEVVAFLVRNSRGQAVTLGLAQGKFRVDRDPKNNEPTVHNLFHGALAGASVDSVRSVPAGGSRLTLADLKHRVQGGSQ
jgi:hypothetical protein